MSDACDLAVIGSGPAGQSAAVTAAKLGKRVALVERPGALGGVCLHTGTIPSKTLREAVDLSYQTYPTLAEAQRALEVEKAKLPPPKRRKWRRR